jgi:hypothetical protein
MVGDDPPRGLVQCQEAHVAQDDAVQGRLEIGAGDAPVLVPRGHQGPLVAQVGELRPAHAHGEAGQAIQVDVLL